MPNVNYKSNQNTSSYLCQHELRNRPYLWNDFIFELLQSPGFSQFDLLY